MYNDLGFQINGHIVAVGNGWEFRAGDVDQASDFGVADGVE